MYITNYPVFSQCYSRSRTEILMAVCLQLLDFLSQESFLERRLHISMTVRFIFSGWFIFRWRGHPIGVASAFMGGGKNIHRDGGTPIVSCLTRENPDLCCKRIKKRQLQYVLQNLQEKDLNFTRKCTSSQINF